MNREQAIAQVRAFLLAAEAGRLAEAERLLAPSCEMIFPGGARFSSLAAVAAALENRYHSIGKRFEAFDAVELGDGAFVVYCRGTLYGRWLDGVAFEGIRFIDRFEIDAAGIRRQEVWNDAGLARLARAAAQSADRSS